MRDRVSLHELHSREPRMACDCLITDYWHGIQRFWGSVFSAHSLCPHVVSPITYMYVLYSINRYRYKTGRCQVQALLCVVIAGRFIVSPSVVSRLRLTGWLHDASWKLVSHLCRSMKYMYVAGSSYQLQAVLKLASCLVALHLFFWPFSFPAESTTVHRSEKEFGKNQLKQRVLELMHLDIKHYGICYG